MPGRREGRVHHQEKQRDRGPLHDPADHVQQGLQADREHDRDVLPRAVQREQQEVPVHQPSVHYPGKAGLHRAQLPRVRVRVLLQHRGPGPERQRGGRVQHPAGIRVRVQLQRDHLPVLPDSAEVQPGAVERQHRQHHQPDREHRAVHSVRDPAEKRAAVQMHPGQRNSRAPAAAAGPDAVLQEDHPGTGIHQQLQDQQERQEHVHQVLRVRLRIRY